MEEGRQGRMSSADGLGAQAPLAPRLRGRVNVLHLDFIDGLGAEREEVADVALVGGNGGFRVALVAVKISKENEQSRAHVAGDFLPLLAGSQRRGFVGGDEIGRASWRGR